MSIPDVLLPVIHIKTNSLDALLTGIGLRFLYLSKTNSEFQALLADRKFILQLASREGVARHFVINHGVFKQYYGFTTQPSLTMMFQDNITGVNVLTNSKPTAFIQAIQNQELVMEGDFSLLMWFGEAGKLITPKIPSIVETAYSHTKPYTKTVTPMVKSVLKKIKKSR